jgi:hypothetical protein
MKFNVTESQNGWGHPVRRRLRGGDLEAAELTTVVTRGTPNKP